MAVNSFEVVYAGAIHDSNLFTTVLPANDDDSSPETSIGFTINFFGVEYDTLYVNNNGNVTFNEPLSTYSPGDLVLNGTPILAPFFADVDTEADGAGTVTYGANTLGGYNVFGVNWLDVGHYSAPSEKHNSFQLIIVDRSDVSAGDFDFEFNYDNIEWETGDASDGENGLGGDSAIVGYSNGVDESYELPGSGVNGALINGGANALISGSLNSDTLGQYIFRVRGGVVGNDLDLSESLSATGKVVNSALRSSELVMNGAHSRPLARRVAEGENAFWVAGDWGGDHHRDRSGTLGVAEVGVGHNFGSLQVNGSVGRSWNSQDLPFRGDFDADTNYVFAEALVPLKRWTENDAWFSVGGYYGSGDADIRRGYIVNSGEYDFSKGSPDLDLWWFRARVDVEDAWRVQEIGISPFAEIARGHVDLDGYTEENGSYRAMFDSRSEYATELRLGFNASRPLNSRLSLLGQMEVSHRLDDRAPDTRGELLTVGTFDFEGESYDRTWIRAGAGVEGTVGVGKGSIVVNATSRGEAPNVWVAANWQMAF